MFPDIIPSAFRRITACSHVTRPGVSLEIPSPADLLVLKQVYDRGDVFRYAHDIVMVEAKVVARYGGEVVGLTRVGMSVVPRLEDAVPLQIDKIGVLDYFRKILKGECVIYNVPHEPSTPSANRAYLVL